MTMGYWKCDYCDFGFLRHISQFVPVCLNCKTEYALLGECRGFHTAHNFPISLPAGSTDFESVNMVKEYCSHGDDEMASIVCFNEDYCDFLTAYAEKTFCFNLSIYYIDRGKQWLFDQKERGKKWLFDHKDRIMKNWEREQKRQKAEGKEKEK